MGCEVCCSNSNPHGITMVILEWRWFKAWVVLIEAHTDIWIFRFHSRSHYFYSCIKLFRRIIQIFIFLLFWRFQRIFWQVLHVLCVRLTGVSKILGPQSPTFKLMMSALFVWMEIPLMLLQIAQKSKFLFTHWTNKDIPYSMKQKAMFWQVCFIPKKLYTEFTFEGPFFSMNG